MCNFGPIISLYVSLGVVIEGAALSFSNFGDGMACIVDG